MHKCATFYVDLASPSTRRLRRLALSETVVNTGQLLVLDLPLHFRASRHDNVHWLLSLVA